MKSFDDFQTIPNKNKNMDCKKSFPKLKASRILDSMPVWDWRINSP